MSLSCSDVVMELEQQLHLVGYTFHEDDQGMWRFVWRDPGMPEEEAFTSEVAYHDELEAQQAAMLDWFQNAAIPVCIDPPARVDDGTPSRVPISSNFSFLQRDALNIEDGVEVVLVVKATAVVTVAFDRGPVSREGLVEAAKAQFLEVAGLAEQGCIDFIDIIEIRSHE